MALHGYKRWKLKRHDRGQTFDPTFKPDMQPRPKLKSPQKVGRKIYLWDPQMGWVQYMENGDGEH